MNQFEPWTRSLKKTGETFLTGLYIAISLVSASFIGTTIALHRFGLGEAVSTANASTLRNEVLIPEYIPVEHEDGDTAPEKVQFEPVTDEKPFLVEKTSPGESAQGAHYPESKEHYVYPEPDVVTNDDAIEEEESTPPEETIVIKRKAK